MLIICILILKSFMNTSKIAFIIGLLPIARIIAKLILEFALKICQLLFFFYENIISNIISYSPVARIWSHSRNNKQKVSIMEVGITHIPFSFETASCIWKLKKMNIMEVLSRQRLLTYCLFWLNRFLKNFPCYETFMFPN